MTPSAKTRRPKSIPPSARAIGPISSPTRQVSTAVDVMNANFSHSHAPRPRRRESSRRCPAPSSSARVRRVRPDRPRRAGRSACRYRGQTTSIVPSADMEATSRVAAPEHALRPERRSQQGQMPHAIHDRHHCADFTHRRTEVLDRRLDRAGSDRGDDDVVGWC